MAEIQLNLSGVRKKYRLSPSCENENLWTICDKDKPDTVYGNLGTEKSKIYFHGIPGTEPRRVKSIEMLDACIADFLKECEKRWVDPRGVVTLYNKMARAEFALYYVANRLNWASVPTGKGSGWLVGPRYFGCDLLRVSVDRATNYNDGVSFHIGYRDNSLSSTSPFFTDYLSALEWLQSTLVPIMFLVGGETIMQASQLEPEKSHMGDTMLDRLRFGGGGISVESKPLREVMIELLEHQLNKLKEEK